MNQLVLLSEVSGVRMTSGEIAELVGSRPDSVKRTIERLAESGVIRLPPLVETEKINNLGLKQCVSNYVFEGEQGKRDSIIVVAQLSPLFTAKLVDRWQELEKMVSKIPAQKPQKEQLKTGTTKFVQTSKEMVALAKAFGFKGNSAYLSADKAVKKLTGTSPLELLGQTHLRAEKKEVSFTPTQIGQMFALNLSGKRINQILAEIGMQKNIAGTWVLTDAGREYGEVLDTGKAHNSGTPVKQIKWFESVVSKINDHLDLLK